MRSKLLPFRNLLRILFLLFIRMPYAFSCSWATSSLAEVLFNQSPLQDILMFVFLLAVMAPLAWQVLSTPLLQFLVYTLLEQELEGVVVHGFFIVFSNIWDSIFYVDLHNLFLSIDIIKSLFRHKIIEFKIIGLKKLVGLVWLLVSDAINAILDRMFLNTIYEVQLNLFRQLVN